MTVIILISSITNLLCFYLGAKLANPSKRIDIPNPVKAVKEYKIRKELENIPNPVETLLHNIDIYDGTGNGQQDVIEE